MFSIFPLINQTMFKNILIFTFAIIIAFTTRGNSQINNGKYVENSDYLIFKSDSVTFKLKSDGGVIFDLQASGTYEVFDDFLLIKTSKSNNRKSHNIINKNIEDYVKISVVDLENKPIVGATIEVFDCSEKLLAGEVSDENGMVIFKKMEAINKVTISYIGHESYTFNYSNNYEYKVMLETKRIENQTLAFKINSISENSIKLTMLTINFKIHRNKKNELIDLYKKNRNDVRKRSFIKKK